MALYPDTGEHERMQRSNREFQRRIPFGNFSRLFMALIVLLTCVLILSTLYLVSTMGIITVPWSSNAPPARAQPVRSQGIIVPDVVGMEYAVANQIATENGFVLKVVSGPEKGFVSRQYPMPGTWAPRGAPLLVDLTAS